MDDEFKNLNFIRIFDPIHIPRELVDQVRDKKYTTEKFYEYQKMVCINQTNDGIVINPLNLLFVIANESKKVVGFLWATMSPLSQDLIINTFSMLKPYWHKGRAVKLLEDKCKEIMEGAGIPRVFWISNYPKHSERYGFKRSKGVLMEYKLGENNGRHILRKRRKTDGDSESSDTTATELSGVNA